MADLWNALKQRIEDVYRRERKMLSFFDLTNEITTLRDECAEWAIVPAVTSHRVAKHLTESYAAFFRRLKTREVGEAAGYPRWQRRDRATTIPLGTMSKTGWQLRQRSDNPRSWLLHYKSTTDVKTPECWIHGRGVLPAAVTDWRNADIIWRDGKWWLSVCVEIEPRRSAGRWPLMIRFDLIDCFARVNDLPEFLPAVIDASVLDERLDEMKSERDRRWPRGKRYSDEEYAIMVAANQEISSLSARIARQRQNALHVWTAGIVARASDITIIAPKVRENTRSGRGDAKQWGAHTELVAALNRNTLGQAPAMAIQMIKYKAEEAGIRCDIIADADPVIAVGHELVAAGKHVRRARRQLKRVA
jgi:putative transposase